MITFNVSSYGAVFGTGQSTATQKANKTAVRDACAAAVAAAAAGAAVEVVIDTTGTLEFYIDPATDAVSLSVGGTRVMMARLAPVGAMTVRGLGTSTHLAMFPDAPTFDYVAFYVDEYLATRNVTFKDITFDGPPNFGVDDPTADYNRTFIQHQGTLTPGHHSRSSLLISNVVQTGACHGGPNSNSGDIDIAIVNSDITALFSTCNIFNQGECLKRVLVENTRTHTTYDSSDQSVGLYIHPNISTRIQNCPLLRTHRRFAVYFNGTPTAPLPEYCEVQNCTVVGGNFLQSNSLAKTTVTNVTSTVKANGAQVTAFAEIEVSYCSFAGGTVESANGPHGTGEHAYMHVHHNSFTNVPGDSIGGCIAGPNWYEHHNTFALSDSQWAAVSPDIAIAGDTCISEDSFLSGTFKSYLACFDTHGDVTLRRISISPTGIGRAVYGIGSVAPAMLRLVLEDCDFNDHAILLLDFENNLVSGTGNTLRLGTPIDFSTGAVSQQRIRNKDGTNPSNSPSASALSLHPNYSVVTVTGVSTIDNLFVSNTAAQNDAFIGHYKLVFASAAALSTAGNIVPLSTAPRAPGTYALVYWNDTTRRWVEYSYTFAVDDRRTLLTDAFAINDQNGTKPYIIARDTRPNAVGVDAPLASLLLCTIDGTLWLKTGNTSTAWSQLAFVP